MEMKTCFKCGRELPLSEFYKHPKMADGHLNKCKCCTKRDIHKNYESKAESLEFLEKERARGRDKYRRLYSGMKKESSHKENKSTRDYLKRLGVELNTNEEIHHWNYNYKKDGFILSKRAHKLIHSELSFDEESKCFYYGIELITNRNRHLEVMKEIIRKNGKDYAIREHYALIQEPIEQLKKLSYVTHKETFRNQSKAGYSNAHLR